MWLPREELLHHIWKFRLFRTDLLRTVDGHELTIQRPGRHNHDAGPDFSDARLNVDGTQWAGNVEVHVRSSDWLKHGHQSDPSYSNIILHVVYEHDLQESLGDFPTLELKHLVSDQVLNRYRSLEQQPAAVPCGEQFMQVPPLVRDGWLDTLLVERLMHRAELLQGIVEQTGGDLEQAFQTVIFRAFGMKVNAGPFEQLSRHLNWKILAKHADNALQLEALLLGTAGMLKDAFNDPHVLELKQEFTFLEHKYELKPMQPEQWKLLRLRPANFPALRMAQLAALLHRTGPLLRWFRSQDLTEISERLRVQPSPYWENHYHLGKPSRKKKKSVGKSMARNLLINAYAPFLFVLSDREGNEKHRDTAMKLLQALHAERNAKVQHYNDLGMRLRNAADTQALIQLHDNYCRHRKCLNCTIGATILKKES